MEDYKTCARCVMTEKSDPFITFDELGHCNYCNDALKAEKNVYFPNEEGKRRLDALLNQIKTHGKDREYDCIMGLSGGLDSSYLAYVGAAKWNLRILAVHIEDGFDTEVSTENINRLCEKSGINLVRIKPDEKQFNELIRAYVMAGVPNLAVPQDNAIFAYLYKYAIEHNIRYFLSGSNFSLECILQRGHTHSAFDLVNLKDINRRFGREKLNRLYFISELEKKFLKDSVKLLEACPLNYIEYEKDRAFKELKEYCGFEYYGSKHLENYLTAFLQLYWLPVKFGVDKRTSHLSSLVITNQITREEALKFLQEMPCSEEFMARAIQIVKEKLDISDQEFERVMENQTHEHMEYRYDKVFRFALNIFLKLKQLF